ncbi:MAG: hypothetical protein U9P12_10420, partial [Verrucomicrobiota bacterium]|nr:hypothetical protein [Verrucomicrobiota bacterium]
MRFQPDYRHVVDAACNREAKRLPLYEHGFDASVIKKVTGEEVGSLLVGSYADKIEAQRRVCRCAIQLGYDCIPFERCVISLVQDGHALMGHAPAIIETMEDVENYPWEAKLAEYIGRFDEDFSALREAL